MLQVTLVRVGILDSGWFCSWKEMFDVSFRTWWKYNWKKLFSQTEQIPEDIKYPMTTDGKNANAIKVALEVYRRKDKDNWGIVIDLEKKKKSFRAPPIFEG